MAYISQENKAAGKDRFEDMLEQAQQRSEDRRKEWSANPEAKMSDLEKKVMEKLSKKLEGKKDVA